MYFCCVKQHCTPFQTFVTEVSVESWPSDSLFVPLQQAFERRMFLKQTTEWHSVPRIKMKMNGWQSTGTGRLWSLPHWRHSKATWTRSGVTCFRWCCLGKGSGVDDLQRSLPALTILWFWEIRTWVLHCRLQLKTGGWRVKDLKQKRVNPLYCLLFHKQRG